ncbi:hypothetical protein EDD63_11153 [Breznakia blatticola]|uniref:Uncharacterized protein n=1 Tax=Breznakia blatticola TaxID=1754012 RepID=A0A4R7ZY53_9FIRM|nr:hypothetical protein [Breznakia blatticola]TDW20640.1 hypothetical protein EDD63_11153 [Breznakia blatticola]
MKKFLKEYGFIMLYACITCVVIWKAPTYMANIMLAFYFFYFAFRYYRRKETSGLGMSAVVIWVIGGLCFLGAAIIQLL